MVLEEERFPPCRIVVLPASYPFSKVHFDFGLAAQHLIFYGMVAAVNHLSEIRDECSQLNSHLEEKANAIELVLSENNELKKQIEEAILKAKTAEDENKMLIDHWMLQKMEDAERLNEANSLYKDMLDQLKTSSIEQLARQQVDGMVCQSEEGAEYFVESTMPGKGWLLNLLFQITCMNKNGISTFLLLQVN